MPTGTKDRQVADQLVHKACARNVPIELHHERGDGQVITCRTRLLEVAGDRILVETPRQVRELIQIPLRRPLRAHMILNGTRYEFGSAIEDVGLTAQLNARLRVRALAIRMPSKIVESQRRSSYRLSLAADELPVIIAPRHPGGAPACPVLGPHLSGRLVNVSSSGVAVLVSGRQRRMLTAGERFYLVFDLPDEEETFLMLAVVRHTRTVGSNESVRAGMAFQPWEGCDLKTEGLRVARFIAKHERKFLKRKR